ncbi:MAG: YncE family protein [Gemmatimonadales bacterium]|jgi:YVTN family beta-propeller protein
MKIRAVRLVAILAAGLIPAAGCASAGNAAPVGQAATRTADQAQHQYLYVTNQSSATVTVIDMETDEVVDTVDLQALGFSANCKPHDIAVEPDGSFWYVSLIADGFVLKFDRDNELVGRAPFETPGLLQLDPSSDLLYVGRSMAAVNPPQRIGVIERPTMDIDEVDVFVARPHALAVSHDGKYVYTASLATNDMVVYRPETGESEVIHVPGTDEHPHTFVDFEVSPDGRSLIATTEMTSKLLVMDETKPATIPIVHTTDVPQSPWHPAFSPDGSRLYFGNLRANAVTFIDTSDWSIARVVEDPRFAQPHGIAVSADGKKLYVGNRNTSAKDEDGNAVDGFVAVIDTSTGNVIKLIEADHYPAGMGTNTRVD